MDITQRTDMREALDQNKRDCEECRALEDRLGAPDREIHFYAGSNRQGHELQFTINPEMCRMLMTAKIAELKKSIAATDRRFSGALEA